MISCEEGGSNKVHTAFKVKNKREQESRVKEESYVEKGPENVVYKSELCGKEQLKIKDREGMPGRASS